LIGILETPMPSVEKKLTFWGALCVLVSGTFFLLPGINAIGMVVTAALLALIVARLGHNRAILVALPGLIGAVLVCSLTFGYLEGLQFAAVFLFMTILPGYLTGSSARKLHSPGRTMITGIVPLGILYLYFLWIYKWIMSDLPTLIDRLNANITANMAAMPLYKSQIEKLFPPADGSMDRFIEALDKMFVEFMRIVPGIMALGLLASMLAAFLLAGSLSGRMGIIFPRFGPFHTWRASGLWLLLTILGLVPVVFSDNTLYFYAGVNLLLVAGHVYMVIGFSIMESYFRRLYKPRLTKGIFYGTLIFLAVFGLISPILLYAGLVIAVFLAALGLADNRFDFRKENFDTNNE